MTDFEDRFLHKRGNTWHYKRWVPEQYRVYEPRPYIRKALKTKSIHVARLRRDSLAQADESYWNALALEAATNGHVVPQFQEIHHQQYKAASDRAIAFGFKYKTAQKLYDESALDEGMRRIDTLKSQFNISEPPPKKETVSLLGGVNKPKFDDIPVSQAFESYVKEIAFDAQLKKSISQRNSWEKAKRTALKYFIESMGDIPISSITREIAQVYKSWWANRIKNGDEKGNKPIPYTANRHIGNMKSLYREYYEFHGEYDKTNPFHRLRFREEKNKTKNKRPPFSNEWVRNNILVSGMFDTLNDEARNIIFTVIETGARPSEICNLLPENIHLSAPIPYISIREKDNREVKAANSNRDIPLIGVALEAMKKSPNGFPRYFDKETSFSAVANKAFRTRNLFPTKDHKIYSFRHSFEDRMVEADIDYALRCLLMGHKNDRPSYGTGGSLEHQRERMLKIVHPFPNELVI